MVTVESFSVIFAVVTVAPLFPPPYIFDNVVPPINVTFEVSVVPNIIVSPSISVVLYEYPPPNISVTSIELPDGTSIFAVVTFAPL